MKKKIIALMMIIPLLLMFTVFNAASSYSLLIDVSVGGVTLECSVGGDATVEDDYVQIDMADKTQSLKLSPVITPLNAKNKKYTYSISPVLENGAMGNLNIDDNGNVTLLSPGVVAITVTTLDGGFKDKLMVQINCSRPSELSITSTDGVIIENKMNVQFSDLAISLGVKTNGTSGSDSDRLYDVLWQWKNGTEWSSIDNCPTLRPAVNGESGEFNILMCGTVTIRAMLKGEHTESGNPIQSELEIVIINPLEDDFMFLGGLSTQPETEKTLSVKGGSAEVNILIDPVKWAVYYNKSIDSIIPELEVLTTYEKEELNVQYTYNSHNALITAVITQAQLRAYSASFVSSLSLSHTFKFSISLFDKTINVALNFSDALVSATEFDWKQGNSVIAKEEDGTYKAFVEYNLDGKTSLTIKNNSGVAFALSPSYTSSDMSIAVVSESSGGTVSLRMKGIGKTTIKATMTMKRSPNLGGNYSVTKVIEVNLVKVPKSIKLEENQHVFGLENILTIGGRNLTLDNQSYATQAYRVKVASDATEGDLSWQSSDERIATVSQNGAITIVSDGKVTIKVSSKNATKVGKSIGTSYEFKCVKEGVNVSTYAQLLFASTDDRVIILTNSIGSDSDIVAQGQRGSTNETTIQPYYVRKSDIEKFGLKSKFKWYNFDLADETKVVAFTSQKATSDLQYNQNDKDVEIPKSGVKNDINIGITFSKSVHGNGYFINSSNLTKIRKDTTDAPLLMYDSSVTGAKNQPIPFNGAVTFVSATKGETYTVFGQDNVGFFVKGQGTVINNIQLQNSDDGMEDLAVLDYAGTTVEVAGKNIKIINSRLKLGRNVLRVFSGDANNYLDDTATSLVVEKCILGQSREFTVRIGANKVKKYASGTYNGENYGPKLFDYINPTRFSERGYGSVGDYNNQLLDTADYTDKIIRTFVTLKDCVLEKSGVFSIGVESHFAGRYLNEKVVGYGWKDCIGTSYGARLSLEGQVRIYDWKNIATINTGSMVGLVSKDNQDPFGMTNMISKLNEQYNSITTRMENGKQVQYVHGGIAFYGGGRNYSLIDNRSSLDNLYKVDMPSMVIGLQDLGNTGVLGQYMLGCSGDDKFQFYMFGDDSRFSLAQQEQDYQTGMAYNWMNQNA